MCLEHKNYHAVYRASDYKELFFHKTKRGSFSFHSQNTNEACYTMKTSHRLIVGILGKNYDFRNNLTQLFIETQNNFI